MATDPKVATAIETARRRADLALQRQRAFNERRERALAEVRNPVRVTIQAGGPGVIQAVSGHTSAGYLAALGDSWFQYPFGPAILKQLEALGYDVESTAHHGARLEVIAYQGGQIDDLAGCLHKIKNQGQIPKAVLVSAGGNDIVADDFGLLLNSAVSPITGWNYSILDGIINERVRTAYYALFTQINVLCVDFFQTLVPIVYHGYDYLVPDGRGILFGWLAGPWLKPGFEEKDFSNVETNRIMMRDVIERLHVMLLALSIDPLFANLHYLSLRGTLPTDSTYKHWWANELHPTDDGFEAVAAQFADLLSHL